MLIDFGKNNGSAINSQLITEGRLAQGEDDEILYSRDMIRWLLNLY